MAKRKTLDRWIAESLSDEDKEAPLMAFELVHVIGQSERHVHSVKLGNKAADPKNLAALFQGKAEDQAQDLTGVQHFRLKAYYGTSDTEGASLTFVVTGQTDWGLATEGPDERGQKQQNMRLTEAIVQGALMKDKVLFGTMVQVMGEMNTSLRSALIENREVFGAYKELTMQIAEKRFEYEGKLETRRDIGKLIGMVPALVNSIAGSEVMPESTEDTAIIGAMFDSASEAELQGVIQFLGAKSPKLASLLTARLERELEKRNKAKEDKTKVKQLTARAVQNGNGTLEAEGVSDDEHS